jgi:hypothetical protein
MRIAAALAVALLVLTLAARLRPPEYDEAYSIFLTAGDARPAWPQGIFHPGDVRKFYRGAPGPIQIARDLRSGDVHPPLYFWTLEYWRRLAGPGWFAARMLSVIFSMAALAALAWLSSLAKIPVPATLLVASLSYGFVYTGIVGRGFALAQFLNILGMALTLKGDETRKWALAFAGGLAFGAAGFTNYLAIFIGLATVIWFSTGRAKAKTGAPAAIGLALFLPLIGFFTIAQHNSRIGQFVAFSPAHAGFLIAKDGAASLFGGLPLYAGQAGYLVAAALALITAVCAGFIVKNWQPKLALFAIAAVATPAGLLALGLVFNNTPIEIRYLAFSLPPLALLLAQTLPRRLLTIVLCIEACGIAGLITAPATMQPQGIAARQLRGFATPSSLVLLPFGNDGVGIPGPFIASAPAYLRLELIKPGPLPDLTAEHHVILVTIHIDAASKLETATTLAKFNVEPCWHRKFATNYFTVFNWTCGAPLRSH